MSDARDAISNAMAMNKKLAASLLVRKQKLAAAGASGEELAEVERELAAAQREIAELRRLAAKNGTLSASEIQAMADDDPFGASSEDMALERARSGINELDAEAELTERPAQAAPAAKPSKEEADKKALEEFEALKAGPKKTKRTMG